jgi:SAM-dependent methyltransferase
VLTDAAGADDMALAMQSVPALGRVEGQVAACFRSGAGLPAAALQEWNDLRREGLTRRNRASLIDGVLPAVPGLVERLRAGIDVLHLEGAGDGLMQRTFPASRFCTGNPDGAGGAGFDLVTAFDFLHEQPRPEAVLAVVHDVLRPGGTFLCMEMAGSSELADNVEHPLGPAIYTMSMLHCLPISRGAGGVGLGAMWGEARARRMMAAAGLGDVSVRRIENDVSHVYYVATKPA